MTFYRTLQYFPSSFHLSYNCSYTMRAHTMLRFQHQMALELSLRNILLMHMQPINHLHTLWWKRTYILHMRQRQLVQQTQHAHGASAIRHFVHCIL